MTVSYKPLALGQIGTDFSKQVSTSGTLHTVIPSRNSILLAPDSDAVTLVVDIENLAALIGEIRGQSNDLGAQFQTRVGPNAQSTLHLPYSGDWSFSVSCPFKISRVQAINFFPDAHYDQVGVLAPVIRVTGQNLTRDSIGYYEVTGLANAQIPAGYGKNDLLLLDSHGTDVVWKLGEIRFRHTGTLTHYVPMNTVPQVLAVGAQTKYKFSFDIFFKKKINLAYVAPEAALWAFENELG